MSDKTDRKVFCTWSHRMKLPPSLWSGFGDLDTLIRKLVSGAESSLTIVSPYLSAEGMLALRASIAVSAQRGAMIKLVCSELQNPASHTRKGIEVLLEGSDGRIIAERLRILTAIPAWSDLLHAKCILCDGSKGYLGSANLSIGGMDRHFELGVSLDHEQARNLDRLFTYLEADGALLEFNAVKQNSK